jgi:hypothetical protein
MIGWRVFYLDRDVLAAPLGLPGRRLPDEYRLFTNHGPELEARCPLEDHRPPAPDCGCGLYFWPGPLPVQLLRTALRAPIVAQVEPRAPILADPIVDRHRAGPPQRASGLRLHRLWIPLDTSEVVRSGLHRYRVPLHSWYWRNRQRVFDLPTVDQTGAGT